MVEREGADKPVWSPNGLGGTTTDDATLEKPAAGSNWGEFGPDDQRGRMNLRDAREGAAGHRRGEGGPHLLPVAAARLSRRQRAQPAARAAAARRDARATASRIFCRPLRRGQPEHDRRGLRRHGAADAAVLDAVGLVRARRQPLRRRRRRQGRARVLQRLSRRRGRRSCAAKEIRRRGTASRAPRPRRSASRTSPSTARRGAA